MYYSQDNGKKWKPIAKDISNKGYFNWVIPNLKTIDCIFKVESSVEPKIYSISKYSMKITEKALIVIENNFNDKKYIALDSINLNWKSYNLSDKYLNLLLSTDGGKNWKIVKSNFIDKNTTKISLPFINKSSNNCKIKIVESNEQSNFDITQGLFSIIRPKGDLVILAQDKKTFDYNDKMKIFWESKFLSDKKGELLYSLDSGNNWKNIDLLDLSSGTYIWDIPNLKNKSNQCMIKINVIDAELEYKDKIDFFTINPAPFININNDINDTVKTNMPFTINTSIVNTNENYYNLYYSLSNGISWTFIGNNLDIKDFSWNVPSIKGFKNILLKAELVADMQIVDIKKYKILEQSINLTLLKPNGKEKFKVGQEIDVVWSIKKIYDKTIDIYFSIDGGNSWKLIEKNAPNSGKYLWKISDDIDTSKNCKVKVQSNVNQNIFDVSDGLFTIDGLIETFNIITPNGGDLVYSGTSTFIYWENIKNQTDNVNLFYTIDNGQNWRLIEKNVENNGVYNWVVPKSIKYSGKCLVKIVSSKNSKLFGMSDNIFTIKSN